MTPLGSNPGQVFTVPPPSESRVQAGKRLSTEFFLQAEPRTSEPTPTRSAYSNPSRHVASRRVLRVAPFPLCIHPDILGTTHILREL